MAAPLVICIGNVARGDDGVAHEVARLLEADPPAGATVRTAPDLDVGMAEEVAAAGVLIVVDAERRMTPAVEVRPVAAGSAQPGAHAVDASGLIAVARALYGQAPPTSLVSVAAPWMEHTDELSPTAVRAAREAAEVVRELVAAAGRSSGPLFD